MEYYQQRVWVAFTINDDGTATGEALVNGSTIVDTLVVNRCFKRGARSHPPGNVHLENLSDSASPRRSSNFKRPKLLDLFCGAGGAAMGYYRAGFEVIGVDIQPQPRYPFEFHRCDWKEFLDLHWQRFDAFHASPPCQGYSVTKSLSKSHAPLLIGEVRDRLSQTGKPYIIENVVGARADMVNPITLRGNQFGLGVIRDRLFEVNPFLLSSPLLPAEGSTNSHRGMSTGGKYICVAGKNFLVKEASAAMGINWMTQRELAQAIPPAYTEWLGEQILSILSDSANPRRSSDLGSQDFTLENVSDSLKPRESHHWTDADPGDEDDQLYEAFCQGGRFWHEAGEYTSKGRRYYRYRWGRGHRIEGVRHIPGGSLRRELVKERAALVERAVYVDFRPHHEIVGLIDGWRSRSLKQQQR